MHDPAPSPRWVARLSAVLLGWNIGLISAFLFVIATFVLLRKSGVLFQVRNVGAWFVVGFCISGGKWGQRTISAVGGLIEN